MVNADLKGDAVKIVKAGYNYKSELPNILRIKVFNTPNQRSKLAVYLGPEVDMAKTLGAELEGTRWAVAVTGMGVRGSNSTELTTHLESK